MALAYQRFTTAQTDAQLIAAEPGKTIRIVKLLVTTWANLKLTLLSDPGPQEVGLMAPVHVSTSAPLLLHLGRNGAVAAQPGKAVGITAAFAGSSGEYSIHIWYEVVS